MHYQNTLLFIFLCLLPYFSIAQTNSDEKRTHFGIVVEAFVSKQTSNHEYAASVFKPGFSLGFYQHLDLNSRSQLRLGGGVSSYKIAVEDYSPLFPSDFDPSTGMVNIEKSYVLHSSNMLQINIPINIRYKFSEESNHLYVSGGLEGRFVINETIESEIYESGQAITEVNTEPYYENSKAGLSGLLELGYELPLNNNKINISIFGKYGLFTQSEGEFFAFPGAYKGHPFDLGLGFGLIF